LDDFWEYFAKYFCKSKRMEFYISFWDYYIHVAWDKQSDYTVEIHDIYYDKTKTYRKLDMDDSFSMIMKLLRYYSDDPTESFRLHFIGDKDRIVYSLIEAEAVLKKFLKSILKESFKLSSLYKKKNKKFVAHSSPQPQPRSILRNRPVKAESSSESTIPMDEEPYMYEEDHSSSGGISQGFFRKLKSRRPLTEEQKLEISKALNQSYDSSDDWLNSD